MKIIKPTLILNEDQVRVNIRKMVTKAAEHDLLFRPHFKTHQSQQIGELFRAEGVSAITVSSVQMAEYFQAAGWQDITIAFPCNIREYAMIDQLAGKCDLNILIANQEVLNFLKKKLNNSVSFLIEIDNGSHRTGVETDDLKLIDEILAKSEESELLQFKGFLTHAGNSYQAQDLRQLKEIHHSTLQQMQKLREGFIKRFPELIISLGDTPCCSLMNDFAGVDEIRPGNFVFYDLMQEKLGACAMKEIAVALFCPVVAKSEKRLEIAIYGGAIHLSKEYFLDEKGKKMFGKVVLLNDEGWSEPIPNTTLFSLSQEHGIIKTERGFFDRVKIGDLLGILPVHSCLTAQAMSCYETLDGYKVDHL